MSTLCHNVFFSLIFLFITADMLMLELHLRCKVIKLDYCYCSVYTEFMDAITSVESYR